MTFTWQEMLTGMVLWPRNRDPRVRGPKPRIITIEQARELERLAGKSSDGEKTEVSNGTCGQFLSAGLAMALTASLLGCGGQSPEVDGWDRLERDFEAVRTEYRQRLAAANTTVEITDATSFGWVRFEDVLSRLAALRIASGESTALVEKEIAALKAKARSEGEKEAAQYEGGSMAAYAGGLAANEEVAVALSQLLAARKENPIK